MDDAWLAGLPKDASGRPFIGKCVLTGKLGQGGMGAVYRARHTTLAIDVAVKIMLGGEAGAQMLERFFREAQAAVRIEHQNLVRVYDVDRHGTLAYMVMELVEGDSVARLLARAGRMEPAQACGLITQAAHGLAAAHAHGMVHRDVKPDNMLVRAEDGRLKIADLGLVKLARDDAALTAHGAVMGTPAYMAPEQIASARDVDARADVWALGASLYHMLAGRPPFLGGNPFEIVARVVTDPVADPRTHRPDLDPALAAIVMRALAKEPARRTATCQALIDALDAVPAARAARATTPAPVVAPAPAPPPAWPSASQSAPARRAFARGDHGEARKLVEAALSGAPEDPGCVALAVVLDLIDGRTRSAVARLKASSGASPDLDRLRQRAAVGDELVLWAEAMPVSVSFQAGALAHGQLVRELQPGGPGLVNPTDLGMAVVEHLSERSQLAAGLTAGGALSLSDGVVTCTLDLPPPEKEAPASFWQRLLGPAPVVPTGPAIVRLTARGPSLELYALGVAVLRRLEAHFRRGVDQLLSPAAAHAARLDRGQELARWQRFRVDDLTEVMT